MILIEFMLQHRVVGNTLSYVIITDLNRMRSERFNKQQNM